MRQSRLDPDLGLQGTVLKTLKSGAIAPKRRARCSSPPPFDGETCISTSTIAPAPHFQRTTNGFFERFGSGLSVGPTVVNTVGTQGGSYT